MKWIVGIDEAGRGPLAGPVAVGVFAVRKNAKLPILKIVKDSKQCSPELRDELYRKLKDKSSKLEASHAVGLSSSKQIDKYGIVYAIQSAMKKALNKLKLNPSDCIVYLDGSLRAPKEYKNQKTIIKGDSLIPVISAASICAKVMRDRYMTRIAKKHLNYAFDRHKGYGTVEHRALIVENGTCPEHRVSFLRNLLN